MILNGALAILFSLFLDFLKFYSFSPWISKHGNYQIIKYINHQKVNLPCMTVNFFSSGSPHPTACFEKFHYFQCTDQHCSQNRKHLGFALMPLKSFYSILFPSCILHW